MIRHIWIRYRDFIPQTFIYKSGILNDIFTPYKIPNFETVKQIYDFIETANVMDEKKFDNYLVKVLK